MKAKIIALIHLIVILAAYSSPWWLDWKLVLAGAVLYYLQMLIFGGCLLSFAQFARKDEPFTGYYLSRFFEWFGLKLSPLKISRFLNTFLPITLLIIAWIIQIRFGYNSVIKIG